MIRADKYYHRLFSDLWLQVNSLKESESVFTPEKWPSLRMYIEICGIIFIAAYSS